MWKIDPAPCRSLTIVTMTSVKYPQTSHCEKNILCITRTRLVDVHNALDAINAMAEADKLQQDGDPDDGPCARASCCSGITHYNDTILTSWSIDTWYDTRVLMHLRKHVPHHDIKQTYLYIVFFQLQLSWMQWLEHTFQMIFHVNLQIFPKKSHHESTIVSEMMFNS